MTHLVLPSCALPNQSMLRRKLQDLVSLVRSIKTSPLDIESVLELEKLLGYVPNIF